tara:strand:+ start:1386 stop:1847 length:462 start_codon:yes stop_codon:yes gene_type:complete
MGTDKLLNEIALAAAQKGLSLKQVLAWIKKHKSINTLPGQLKIDIAIAIRQFYEKNKKLSPRQLKIKFSQTAAFTKILDKHYKGQKRKGFDDSGQRKWTKGLVLNDAALQTVGAFKRYKLIDNQLLKPTMGMGLLNIFWSSTIPKKLITKPKK